MAEIKIYGLDGAEKSSIEVPAYLFESSVSKHRLHEVIRAEEANARVGTADTKTRTDVSGGGKKPWKQKGTGRARHGSTRSPIWRKGGTVFGPHPRDYTIKLNRKEKKQALAGALSIRFGEERVIGLDTMGLDEPKTQKLVSFLKHFEGIKKPVFIHTPEEKILVKSVNNISNASHRNVQNISTKTLLVSDFVVFTPAAIEALGNTISEEKR